MVVLHKLSILARAGMVVTLALNQVLVPNHQGHLVVNRQVITGLLSDFQILSGICPTLPSGPSLPFCLFSQPPRVKVTVQLCAFGVAKKPSQLGKCLSERCHLRVRGGLLREPLREVLPGGRDRRQGTVY